MISSNSDSVSRRALIGYGLATLPAQFSYVLIIIMNLRDSVVELGASAAAIGSVFLLAKVWDAISDPLVGNLSDRTERSQGRRRPWLYASAPLLFVFFIESIGSGGIGVLVPFVVEYAILPTGAS